MREGDIVRARLYSSPINFVDTREFTVTRIETVRIKIYHSWFVENRGKPVWLNYAVLRSGQPRRLVSEVLYIEKLQVPPL